MPEPYGSPEFRESLKYPNTKVGNAMQQFSDGLARHGSFITAVMEDQFKRMGEGKPGEEAKDPITFDIDGINYKYSVTPQSRPGLLIDDAITVTRGEDSIFLQVSHAENDLSRISDEAVLKFAGQTFKGDEAVEKAAKVFPEFMTAPKAKAA